MVPLKIRFSSAIKGKFKTIRFMDTLEKWCKTSLDYGEPEKDHLVMILMKEKEGINDYTLK